MLIYRLVSSLCLLSLPLSAGQHFTTTLKEITDSYTIGSQNAKFIQDKLTQQLPEDGYAIQLKKIYESIGSLVPNPCIQGGIWLNENGKVLYRIEKGPLYLLDIESGKATEIVGHQKGSQYPYRLNNLDEVLYFKQTERGKWNVLVRGEKERTLLDLTKFNRLKDDSGPEYEEFLSAFNKKKDIRVEFNDLGHVLFAYGNSVTKTWFFTPERATSNLDNGNSSLDWILSSAPFSILGMTTQGDIFIKTIAVPEDMILYKAKDKSKIYFASEHGGINRFITNKRGSVVIPTPFPTFVSRDERDAHGKRIMRRAIGRDHLLKEGSKEVFPPHKFFAQDMNAMDQVIGFGITGKCDYDLGCTYDKAFIKAMKWDITTGLAVVETLGGRRSAALGVNTQGAIVGWAETPEGLIHAFLKMEETTVDIGAELPSESLALDINDEGWVLGIGKDAQGLFQTFLYHREKGLVNVAQQLQGQYPHSFSIPIGFNQKGQVVGVIFHPGENGTLRFPFTYNPANGNSAPLPHYSASEAGL